MGKLKWILICAALVAALGVNATAAGPKSDTNVFLAMDDTNPFAAVLAPLMMSQAGGEELDTVFSVSSTLATPDVAPFVGFPEGGEDTTGAVWLFCYSNDGTSWNFNSSRDLVEGLPIGTGLNEDGELEEGGTFTVYMSQVIRAVTGGEDLDFIGYCYVVGEFDAIAGTFVNYLPLVGVQQDFVMQSDFTGVPIWLAEP